MIATGHGRLGEQWLKEKDAKKWTNGFKAQPKISSDVGFRCQASGDVKQNNSQKTEQLVSVT